MARLKAVNAAEGGGKADGSTAVGAEGDGNKARANSIGGATRRATGVVARVVRVERCTFSWVVVCGVCFER